MKKTMIRLFIFLILASLVLSLGPSNLDARSVPEYRGFSAPRPVVIRGYDGEAMEPFITKDGRYLLFNNSNDPRVNTNLHFAERVDESAFIYKGEIAGVNTAALEGTPSLDREGNLYFVSTRSYAETLSTVYRARFAGGAASHLELVDGISLRTPGILIFDAEIAADGKWLFFAEGRFDGGPAPRSADIILAVRDGACFQSSPDGVTILKNVNTKALEYAPAISSDLLEFFFTRASGLASPVIYRAARRNTEEPFGKPERIRAISGFTEAPTLSGDGRTLFYHKREGGKFGIWMVSR
jgi:Tol biopolymer transport system component